MNIKSNSPRSIFSWCVKYVVLCLFTTIVFGCSNSSQGNLNKTNNAEDTLQLPFIGFRYFETRHGVSGTGTPQWHIQIQRNGDVTFYYVQVNQGYDADEGRPVTTGKYYAGKFQKYIWCNFNEWDNFPRCYEITKDMICEVDSAFRRLSREDCCDNLQETNCPCKGELLILDKEETAYIDSIARDLK